MVHVAAARRVDGEQLFTRVPAKEMGLWMWHPLEYYKNQYAANYW